MFDLAVGFAITGILMTAEYFICTRLNSALWGGIIPALILIGTVWIFAAGKVPLELKTVFPFIICNSIFLGNGRMEERDMMNVKKLNWIK